LLPLPQRSHRFVLLIFLCRHSVDHERNLNRYIRWLLIDLHVHPIRQRIMRL
jgi:hypothetical protein